MTTKKTQKPKKKQRRGVPAYLTDQSGESIPKKYVQDYDVERQMELESVVKEWLAERERLEKLADRTMASASYLEALRGTAMAERGNMQITSFDGLMQLEITTAWRIILDDRAIEAKHAMVEYIKKGLGDVKNVAERQAVLAIIEDTFTPTQAGCLRNGMVVRLLNYKILAQEWQDACTLLRAAMQTIRGKSYLRVKTRTSTRADWEMIRLDMNSCLPEDDS
ncbi:MAG: DUF3164 family protein [Candidatus Cloacimonetes bacterium]|jgi:hypothetical protein|nr:DUF3164 family protein [Candidatus Cloacimonadota bacterium]